MLGIILDAVVLIVLLKVVVDEDVDFTTAIILALGASIGTFALAVGLVIVMGFVGVILAAIIAAAAIGVAVSALFGAEIKRSFLVGILFVVVHVGIAIGFEVLL